MVIRDVNKKDLEALRTIKTNLDITVIQDRLRRQSDGKVNFLLLEINNSPVGYVLLKWDGKPTHPEYPDIEDLYVKDGFRGKGFGTLLIKECETRAIKRKFNKIGLAVNPINKKTAKMFYERLGYKYDGQKTYVDGIYNWTEDWVIDLEKELT